MAIGKYKRWITHEALVKIEGWARDGLNDEQIAHNMGVHVATLYRWEKDHSDICEALKKGKEVVDREVENALLKRALGYEYTEVTEEPVKDPDSGEPMMMITKRVTKQIAPDTTAQIFWLKNRKPTDWRDKRDVELSGKVDVASVISKARERAKHAE